jgi:hypothetical protein
MEGNKFGLKVMILALALNHALCQSISHMEPYSHQELKKRATELDSDLKKQQSKYYKI